MTTVKAVPPEPHATGIEKTVDEIVATITNGISAGNQGSNPTLAYNARVELKSLLLRFAKEVRGEFDNIA